MPDLARLKDIEPPVLMDGFGETPLALARVMDDPAQVAVVGIVSAFIASAVAPGTALLVGGLILGVTINDMIFVLRDDAIDVEAEEVAQEAEEDADDSARRDVLGNVLPERLAASWPPVVPSTDETAGLNAKAWREAKTALLESDPVGLAEVMGDDAPRWLLDAAAAQRAAFANPPEYVPGRTPVGPTEPAPETQSVTSSDRPVTGSGDREVTTGDGCHRDQPVTASDSLGAYVNGLSLAAFKAEFCPQGGQLDPADLNCQAGRGEAAVHLAAYLDHYGRTPVEFAVWWGWGLTKKGGDTPSAKKYRFVAEFVGDVFSAA